MYEVCSMHHVSCVNVNLLLNHACLWFSHYHYHSSFFHSSYCIHSDFSRQPNSIIQKSLPCFMAAYIAASKTLHLTFWFHPSVEYNDYIVIVHSPSSVNLCSLSPSLGFQFRGQLPVPASFSQWVVMPAPFGPRSRRNPKRSRTCISEVSGSTGETFLGFVNYLRSAQPNYFYGEMVSCLFFRHL